MNEDESQVDNQGDVDMTPEEAKAALGLSNRLSEQFLASQVVSLEAPQNAQDGQGEESGSDMEKDSLGSYYDNNETNKDEKLDAIMDEIAEIKEEIVKVLGDDNEDSKKNDNDE